MRFMVIRMADEETEAGAQPTPELLEAMTRYNEELVKAGVMLAGDGLMPSAKGAKVTLTRARTTVTDGPFAEAKELVAGYSLWEVDSLAEALAWAEKWPVEDGHGNVELEIRQVVEVDDFGDVVTEQIRADAEKLRAITDSH